jgi:hypothetical protein
MKNGEYYFTDGVFTTNQRIADACRPPHFFTGRLEKTCMAASSRYRCPNSAGRPFGPWHDTNLAWSKHDPARSVTDPGRHGPFSMSGMDSYNGPRALARPGTIYGSARRRPA